MTHSTASGLPAESAHRHRRGRVTSAVAGMIVLVLAGGLVPASAAVTPAPPRRIVSGWLPYWTSAASTSSVVANADLFTDVSPFWYSATWTGATSSLIQQVSDSSKTTYLPQLQAAGVKVIPSITDGMAARQLAATLASPTERDLFVGRITDLVTTNGYAGIDLDFENFAFSDGCSSWATTRPAWVTFIAQLSAALHAHGALLSVTTPAMYDATYRTAMTVPGFNPCSTTSGYWVYDWAGISTYIDRLRIMTYDYHVSTPGPISPFPWVERVVAFATTQVASGKVFAGVAQYGRDWVRRDAANNLLVTGVCPVDNVPDYTRKTFSAAAVPGVLAARGVTAAGHWDATYQEQSFRYNVTYRGTTALGAATSCVVAREVWYDEARAAVARAALVPKYHLGGIAEWTVGGEDPAQWSSLRTYASTIAPTPTVVTLTASPVVTYGVRAGILAQALSSGVAVDGVPAILYFRKTGVTPWTKVATGTTDSTGAVRFAMAVVAAGQYHVVVQGTFERLTGSATKAVGLRTAIRLYTNGPNVAHGQLVRVSAVLLPAISGQKVLRQILQSSGQWITLATASADSLGRVGFRFTAGNTGVTRTYRLVAVGTPTVTGATAGFTITGT